MFAMVRIPDSGRKAIRCLIIPQRQFIIIIIIIIKPNPFLLQVKSKLKDARKSNIKYKLSVLSTFRKMLCNTLI